MKAYGISGATILWGFWVLCLVRSSESLNRRAEIILPQEENEDFTRQFNKLWKGIRKRRIGAPVDPDRGIVWKPRRNRSSEFLGEQVFEGSENSGRWEELVNGVEEISLLSADHERRRLDRAEQDKREGQGRTRRGTIEEHAGFNIKTIKERGGVKRLTREEQNRVNGNSEEWQEETRRVVIEGHEGYKIWSKGEQKRHNNGRIERKKDKGGEEERQNRNKRAIDSGVASKERSSNKTIFGGVSREKERQLNEIAREDMIASLFEFVEVAETSPTQTSTRNCTLRLNDDVTSLLSPNKIFREQTIKSIQTANTLSNVFRNPPEVPLHDHFFFALIEGLVQSDPLIYGAAIAFDPGQQPNPQRPLSPYVHRGPASGYLQIRNVTKESRGRYAVNGTEGYEWFWKQRKDFSSLLWAHRDVCAKVKVGDEAQLVADIPTAVSSMAEGLWGNFQYDCSVGRVWTLAYSIPFFGCNAQRLLVFKGVLKVDIDLSQVDLDQCSQNQRLMPLVARHRCPSSTQCVPLEKRGFRRGSYRCECLPGYYLPSAAPNSTRNFFHGSQMEALYIARLQEVHGRGGWMQGVECRQCSPGCTTCVDDRSCTAEYDVIVRSIPLVIESLCISVDVVLLVVVVWMRKAKVRRACLWCLVEATIVGNILIHSTVVVQYFEPTKVTCFLVPWLRELGFSIVYGALSLRIYRVLTEFQSRKAHRVQMRDKDLVKYLSAIVIVVFGYMVAWTAVTLDNLSDADTLLETGVTGPDNLRYSVCQSRWWDYAAETAELMFLSVGIYECYCARSAPSDYREVRFITWAIINEAFVSIFFYIARHCLWMSIHPDYLYLMYFIRCQLTASGMLLLVLGPKLWYSYRPPTDDGSLRSRTYSSSGEGCQDSLRGTAAAGGTASETVKLNNIGSNGEVDVEDINLSEMNPEDIRNELKRLYTQLQIYKTKTMRQDNPHISKRRGGRKQTIRRFSFQPFHAKNRPHPAGAGGGGPVGGAGSEHGGEMAEVSRTPEESSNSAEGVSVYMDESSTADTRAPPAAPSSTGVSFKAGRNCKYAS